MDILYHQYHEICHINDIFYNNCFSESWHTILVYNLPEYIIFWFKGGLNHSLRTEAFVLWSFPFWLVSSDVTVEHFVRGLWGEEMHCLGCVKWNHHLLKPGKMTSSSAFLNSAILTPEASNERSSPAYHVYGEHHRDLKVVFRVCHSHICSARVDKAYNTCPNYNVLTVGEMLSNPLRNRGMWATDGLPTANTTQWDLEIGTYHYLSGKYHYFGILALLLNTLIDFSYQVILMNDYWAKKHHAEDNSLLTFFAIIIVSQINHVIISGDRRSFIMSSLLENLCVTFKKKRIENLDHGEFMHVYRLCINMTSSSCIIIKKSRPHLSY